MILSAAETAQAHKKVAAERIMEATMGTAEMLTVVATNGNPIGSRQLS